MARNFVILYTAREGSSAIVSQLSAQAGVHVPLFEALDPYSFRQRHAPGEIYDLLDRALGEGKYDNDPNAGRGFLSPSDPAEAHAIGFKWRYHGDPARIAEIFARHGVVVFLLHRRDFDELCASLYLTEWVHQTEGGVRHPQFDRKKASSVAEREVPLRPLMLLKIMAARARRAWRMRNFARVMDRAGVPVRVIYYEDFTADNLAFLTRFLGELGMGSEAVPPDSAFEKVAARPAKDRINDLGPWLSVGPIPLLRRFYQRELRLSEELAQKSS